MIKLKDLLTKTKLTESTVKISTMKDVAFAGRDRLALYGKKGKVGLDRKSVSALVKAVRQILGRSFTAHEVKEGKLNEAKMVTLPNGVKVKIEFKGITLQSQGKKPVFLDRRELMTFFKATSKYMKVKNEGKLTEKEFVPTITIDFTRENRGKGRTEVKKFKTIPDAKKYTRQMNKKYKLKRQKGFWGNPVTGIELSQNFS